MIRINLLGVERQQTRKAAAFDLSQQVTTACLALLALAVAGNGYWYWSLSGASAQVDADLATAQQEAARIRTVIAEVQQFETQRAQLQQRVALIEQLRGGQSVPVQLLDHVSRSLPDMLWLTQFEQKGSDVTIEGRSTTLIALSDFVGNLGSSPLLQKPIEIVNSQVEAAPGGPSAGPGAPAVEVIKFTVKAQLATPGTAPAGAAVPAQGAVATTGAAR